MNGQKPRPRGNLLLWYLLVMTFLTFLPHALNRVG